MFEIVQAIHKALKIESTWAFVLVVAIGCGAVGGFCAWVIDKGYKNSPEYKAEHLVSAPPLMPAPVKEEPLRQAHNGEEMPPKTKPKKRQSVAPSAGVRIEQQSSGPGSPNTAVVGSGNTVTVNPEVNPYAPIVTYDFNGAKHVQEGNRFEAIVGDEFSAFPKILELNKNKQWLELRGSVQHFC